MTLRLGLYNLDLRHCTTDLVRKVYTVSATSVLDSSVFCVHELTVYCCIIFCCCCFSFCCRGLFVSFTGTIHREGSSPSYAAGRRLGGFLRHHQMLLDNLRSLYITVRVAPQAAGFCKSWTFGFLTLWTATEQQLSAWMRKGYGN